jgi:AGCS family alanine or glycine:cation symporter
VQSNGIAISFSNTLHVDPAWVGAAVALLIGLVVMGGVKRIANVAQIVAPFMAVLYVLLSIVVLAFHITEVPHAFMDMIHSAFGMKEALGGILGSTIDWGVQRGIYSNEAGQGTGAIVAGAAKVSHPVKQGLVQAFSVYIDTLLVCTATAVMILACKTYNVFDGAGNILVAAEGVDLGAPGVNYTSAALGTFLGSNWGGIIVSVALFFFAFTTIMAYYYYAETNLVYLFGKGKKEHILIWVLRLGVVGMVFFGSLYEAKAMWDLGDIGVGTMAWVNIIVILLLSPKAFKALKSYERQKKEGKEPVFDPKEIGVEGADFWESRQPE